jgi:MFS family permease
LLLLAWGVAAIFGPFLGGRVYVATGEYRYAFFVAAAMSIAALATLAFARGPHASGSENLDVRTEKVEVKI